VHVPGAPGGGAKTLYALPHDGKTLEQVVAAAESHHAVKRCRAFVAAEKARLEALRADRRVKETEDAAPAPVFECPGPESERVAYARARALSLETE